MVSRRPQPILGLFVSSRRKWASVSGHILSSTYISIFHLLADFGNVLVKRKPPTGKSPRSLMEGYHWQHLFLSVKDLKRRILSGCTLILEQTTHLTVRRPDTNSPSGFIPSENKHPRTTEASIRFSAHQNIYNMKDMLLLMGTLSSNIFLYVSSFATG